MKFAEVFKFNENHDEAGRFASGDGAGGGTSKVIGEKDWRADRGKDGGSNLASKMVDYFGGGNAAVDTHMREPDSIWDADNRDLLDEVVATVNKGFDTYGADLPEGTQAYRAVGPKFYGALDAMKDGDTFSDKAFTQLTTNVESVTNPFRNEDKAADFAIVRYKTVGTQRGLQGYNDGDVLFKANAKFTYRGEHDEMMEYDDGEKLGQKVKQKYRVYDVDLGG